MGYAIVIDASVARAAGESGKPEPSACRATLLAMLTHNHKVAMSVSLRGEWMKPRPDTHSPYATAFALRWLTQMQSQRRVIDITSSPDSEALRNRCIAALDQNPQTKTSAPAVAKDFHLVDLALQTDRRVVSLDRKIVTHLALLKDSTPEICPIMWLHPVQHDAAEWLRNGGFEDEQYYVCRSAGPNE